MQNVIDRLKKLPIWKGQIEVSALTGGITNFNFIVSDEEKKTVVRIGDDILVHHIKRFNELSASQAAHAAQISPAVIYHETGLLVIEYVPSRTLAACDFHDPIILREGVFLIKNAHMNMPKHLRGPALVFWVFHVIRNYVSTLENAQSIHASLFSELLEQASQLEKAVGKIDLVFGHNDLLQGNFLHDGNRIWLIDWDYAGFNSPLFDLGGLATNCDFSESQEMNLLELYFEEEITSKVWKSYQAMKTSAALRETLWSMVSEIFSDLDHDFSTYTQKTLSTYHSAWNNFIQT